MKEFRVIPVELQCMEIVHDPNPGSSHTLTGRVKDFFNPTAYTTGRLLTENAEDLMHDMYCKGWEVVSTAAIGTYPDNVTMLITFARGE